MPRTQRKNKVKDATLNSIPYPNALSSIRSSDMPVASSSPVTIESTLALNPARYEQIYKNIVQETKLEFAWCLDRYSTTVSKIIELLPKEILNCYPSVCNLDQGENGIDIIDSLILENKEDDVKKPIGRPKRTKAKADKDDKFDFKKKIPMNSQMTNTNYSSRSGAPLLLRKPQMEEMVISLNGTPIKATTDTSRDVELTIPIGDGKVISLLPNEELVGKSFPQLNAATMEKLTVLGKILNSITESS